MIVELFMNIIYGGLISIINLLPAFDGLAFVLGAITGLQNILHVIEFFVPVSVLFVGIGVIVAIDLFMWGTWIVNWLVHRIPFVG